MNSKILLFSHVYCIPKQAIENFLCLLLMILTHLLGALFSVLLRKFEEIAREFLSLLYHLKRKIFLKLCRFTQIYPYRYTTSIPLNKVICTTCKIPSLF